MLASWEINYLFGFLLDIMSFVEVLIRRFLVKKKVGCRREGKRKINKFGDGIGIRNLYGRV